MIGVEGLEEKGINLEISLLLKESLENAGYQVIMTGDRSGFMIPLHPAKSTGSKGGSHFWKKNPLSLQSVSTRTAIRILPSGDHRCFIMKAL